MIKKIQGLRKYTDCSMPTTEADHYQKVQVCGYNRALADVVKLLEVENRHNKNIDAEAELLKMLHEETTKLIPCPMGIDAEEEIRKAALIDYKKQTTYDSGFNRQKGFIEGARWALNRLAVVLLFVVLSSCGTTHVGFDINWTEVWKVVGFIALGALIVIGIIAYYFKDYRPY